MAWQSFSSFTPLPYVTVLALFEFGLWRYTRGHKGRTEKKERKKKKS